MYNDNVNIKAYFADKQPYYDVYIFHQYAILTLSAHRTTFLGR